LGAASLLASQGQDLPRVTLTMAVFGVGAALPLILLGLVSRATLMRVRSSLMSAGKLGKGLLGAAFIVIGVAIVSGTDKRIEAVLVDASPQWLTELTTSF
jgi:cytochrome c-type biogenesis protein